MVASGVYDSDIDRTRQLKAYHPGDPLPAGVDKDVRINGVVYLCGNIRIEAGVILGHNTELWGGEGADSELRIRRGTSIDSQCIIRADGFPVDIGENVTIDAQSKINCMRQKGLPYSGPVTIGNESQLGINAALGNNIKIGYDAFIGPNTTIFYWTQIGDGTQLYNCEIGVHPQDNTWQAELRKVREYLRQNPEEKGKTTVGPTYTILGKECIVKEGCRISRGTLKKESKDHTTTLDDHVDIQDHTHIAHDCHLMRNAHVGSGSKLAGHVVMHPYAALAGAVKVDRFVEIGTLSYVVANLGIARDVPPFTIADYMKGTVRDLRFGLNRKGIKRFFDNNPDFDREPEMEARLTLRRLIESRSAKDGDKRRPKNKKKNNEFSALDAALEAHKNSKFIEEFVAFKKASIERAKRKGLNL
jgi:UDP-N-acetylglucosamine acyltransferase